MKNLTLKFSEEAKRRVPSPMKESQMIMATPGMRSLGGGMPHPSLFPFSNISATFPKLPFQNGVDAPLTAANSSTLSIAKSNAEADGDISLERCMQYCFTRGETELRDFLKEHTRRVHAIPNNSWDLVLTPGSTFAIDALVRTFVNPGESVLMDEFSFSATIQTVNTAGALSVPAKMDLEGLLPEALDQRLEQWVGRKPKFLYTIPTGQNPTGSSLSVERRQKIYQICLKHDIMIVEDDPYYYLQMPTYGADPLSAAKGDDEFPKSLIKSFLSMDTEGIVVRVETFSKTFAPGTRLGWIVGPAAVTEKFASLSDISSQAPCGLSQALVYGTLRRWGQEGYLTWLAGIRKVYTAKRDNCVDAIYKYIPNDLFVMCPPVAGMFVWLKFDARRYKSYDALGRDPVRVTYDLYRAGLDTKVLVMPGHWFMATDNTTPPQPALPATEEDKHAVFIRMTYAAAQFDKMHEIMQAFGDVVREKFV